MDMHFLKERLIVGVARGKSPTAKCYEFTVQDDGQEQEVRLTTGLDVTFLFVRPFTGDSLLVLFFTGDAVQPQFVVAEFHYDDERINHTLDHGPEVESAIGDWNFSIWQCAMRMTIIPRSLRSAWSPSSTSRH